MSEERCELSELLVSQCGCRLHAKPDTAPVHTFTARYPGRCRECGEDIQIGQEIINSPLSGGGYVHEECSGK